RGAAELGPQRAGRFSLLWRRGRQAHRGALRRRARPGRPGAPARRPLEFPPPGRAHQPPRPGFLRGSHRRSGRVRGDAALRLAQPVVRKRARHAGVGSEGPFRGRAAGRPGRLAAPTGGIGGSAPAGAAARRAHRQSGKGRPQGARAAAGEAAARAGAAPRGDRSNRGAHRPAGGGEEGGRGPAGRPGCVQGPRAEHLGGRRVPGRTARAGRAVPEVGGTAGRAGARRGAHGRGMIRFATMKRGVLWLFALVVLGSLGFAAFRLVDERRFTSTPYGQGPRTVMVPARSGPHQLAQLLARAGVVSDAHRFYVHLHYFRRKAVPRAGEYEFDGPLLPDEVLGKLVRGEVKTYRFTLPEGLRADEIAPIVAATTVCSA